MSKDDTEQVQVKCIHFNNGMLMQYQKEKHQQL